MKENCKTSHMGSLRKKVDYLDSNKRKEQFSPESLLKLLPFNSRDNILDIGAGTGFLTIPAARKTNGMVYALDIDSNILEFTRSKANAEELDNVTIIHGEMKDVKLPENSIDIVLASLVLHEIKSLPDTLHLINQVLKVHGYFACVELEENQGQEHNHPRISSTQMEQELKKAGFKVGKKLYPSEAIYVLIAQKVNYVP
ncbi:class I SAM-dependent methyltransferase [Halobacillus sp. A5]|uniref:class I SAM-dependent methyltransferase n=1 Tax=Halobacillus sp. A5 TaxID=2880263 RepID=UPI0020A63EC1|nr:class I SAM-dependent methyltransferase [Halobacillus sp. A5]MCP3028589.1 class I SAM-dependent methyltransferase [Halobacillus sp. A5]